jgi:UDP-3-O-[3-hydroxymyristoyl] N-acetylglucosamine deacetylase
MTPRQTLREPVRLSGVGLHTGAPVDVCLLAAPAGRGRTFVRSDLPGAPELAAQVEAVRPSQLSTLLAAGEASVQTVEHLLAALLVCGIDDVRIEVHGPELPILDGSAAPWSAAIARAGLAASSGPAAHLAARDQAPPLDQPAWVREGDAFVAALPSPALRFSYGIAFLPPIGAQWYSTSPDDDDLAASVLPARTFARLADIERLRGAGLIRGGSLDGALVCDGEGWLNPPLRFPEEPVRHKLLDLLGDLALLGRPPRAHYVAYKAGHRLHVALARELARRAGAPPAP